MAVRTAVLVHGAWHGAWCWDAVIEGLALFDLDAVAVDLPMTSFSEDVRCVQDAIASAGEPLLLCGHSYGGAVITEAGAQQPHVDRLLYICAVAPAKGEATLRPGDERLTLPRNTWIRIEPDKAKETLYSDVDSADAASAISRLRPLSLDCFATPLTAAAWRERTSTYLICSRDRSMPLGRQQEYARRCSTVLQLDSGHSPFLTVPAALAALIAETAADPGSGQVPSA